MLGSMYFVEISTRSSTAYDVTPTAKSSVAAASKHNCLNWESPRVVPKILRRSIVPNPYPTRWPMAIILLASGSQFWSKNEDWMGVLTPGRTELLFWYR